MKTINISKIKELCTKYSDKGLNIDIMFSRWGMTFMGSGGTYRFNRVYGYDLLEKFSDTITLDFLMEEFKGEFKKHLEKERNRHENQLSVVGDIKAEIQTHRNNNSNGEYDKIFELCLLIIDRHINGKESEDES